MADKKWTVQVKTVKDMVNDQMSMKVLNDWCKAKNCKHLNTDKGVIRCHQLNCPAHRHVNGKKVDATP